jgi:hypothetical protein
MMTKIAVCFLVLILSAVAANAAPNATLFGGYQYTRFDNPSVSINSGNFFGSGGLGANGWNAALTGGFNSWLGIRADFSAAYPSGFNFYTYTFGPELSVHLPIVRPFAHALFGGARISSGGSSTTGFDMMLGGGVDVGHGILAWRVAQLDWMSTRFSGFTDNKNVRICTGLVLRF